MSCSGFQPSHAYIPGQTERHAEGAFDHIRNTAKPGMSVEALAQSDAFQTGLRFIDEHYFWEAHEVLEPVWMVLGEDSDERYFVQGLIQMANGFLKLRMNRPKAANRLAIIAFDLVSIGETELVMGIERGFIKCQIKGLEGISIEHYNA